MTTDCIAATIATLRTIRSVFTAEHDGTDYVVVLREGFTCGRTLEGRTTSSQAWEILTLAREAISPEARRSYDALNAVWAAERALHKARREYDQARAAEKAAASIR